MNPKGCNKFATSKKGLSLMFSFKSDDTNWSIKPHTGLGTAPYEEAGV